MKKRANAFRFDFTGQAILYGEVNPIGTRGGPEKNILTENMQGEPLPKRQKASPVDNDIDRKSLYGAQAMQRMDIYAGNIPHQPSSMYAKTEVIGTVGPLSADTDTFYPFGNNPDPQPPMQENMTANNHTIHNGTHGYSNNYTHPLPSQNYLVENVAPTLSLHDQMPVSSNSSGETSHALSLQNDSSMYHSTVPNMTIPVRNVHLKSNPLKRPYPTNTNVNGIAHQPKVRTSISMPMTRNIPQANYAPDAHRTATTQQFHQNNVANSSHQKAVSQMQFYKPHQSAQEPMETVYQRRDQQFTSYVYSQQQNFLQPHGPEPSVTDSLTINSYVNIEREVSKWHFLFVFELFSVKPCNSFQI